VVDCGCLTGFSEATTPLERRPTVKLWFCDECGVEGDPRPRRRWVQPGQARTVPNLGDHIKADWFWGFIARTDEQLTDRLGTSVRSFMNHFSQTASI